MDPGDGSFYTYTYTAGRWAFKEKMQLAERTVVLSKEALVKVAPRALALILLRAPKSRSCPKATTIQFSSLPRPKGSKCTGLLLKFPIPMLADVFIRLRVKLLR